MVGRDPQIDRDRAWDDGEIFCLDAVGGRGGKALKPDYFSDEQWEEHLKTQGKPKRKVNGAHRPDPPPFDSGDAAGMRDDAPFDPDYQPPGESAEFEEVGGITKRVTTLASLNERYAILQADGSASVYVNRQDFLPIQDTDLKRRLAGEVARRVDAEDLRTFRILAELR